MEETEVNEDVLERPTIDEIRSTWSGIFSDPLISLPRIKEAATSKAGLGRVSSDGGITLRSVYWRVYHGILPDPASIDQFPDALIVSRQSYSSLRKRYLLAPDGRWASDCSPPLPEETSLSSPGAGPSRTLSPTIDQKSWDPLSLESESPWKTWFTHLELRQTIRQDVDRTFPDIDYFKLERVRRCMVSILFLYAVLNPDVGYRQGMHELLAVCFWVIDRDSLKRPEEDTLQSPLARDSTEEAMYTTLDQRYIEHDAYVLFIAIMKSAKSSYEWRSEEMSRSRNVGQAQAPIITRCQHIHHGLIGRIDPQLWERLENEGVEAQIWAIRWIRLIFTRELPFTIALQVWDGIFATDATLEILDYICVAMLLLVRNELIEADYPTLLTNLLHYPAPSSTYPFEPSLILSQAIFLRDNVTPASGVQVVIQNQDTLGVKAQPPERPESELPVASSRAGPSRGRGRDRVSVNATGQGRNISGAGAGVQGFAQGWIDRAQAAGLDKAVLSAVSDLRRNLPDTSSAYSYLPNLPFSPLSPPGRDGQFSSIPTSTSALPNRSGYLPRSPSSAPNVAPSDTISISANANSDPEADLRSRLKDKERQMAEMRLIMVGMGKVMSQYLPSPDHDASSISSEDAQKGLRRIRDALLDSADRDVDSMVKEWVWQEPTQSESTTSAERERERPISTSHHRDNTPSKLNHNTSNSNNLHQSGSGAGAGAAGQSMTNAPNSSFPSSTLSAPSKPALHLSRRTDSAPSTGLPRVPQTAPLGGSGMGYRSEVTRRESERKPDPLAGQVDNQPNGSNADRDRDRLKRASAVNDPLGAGL